ncbi:hypothetical protein ABK905_20100 [Acerihabitans sp. KWT182]|uniref:Mandelate racemase/muconate lactonizing enzyme N-terminal domain-containing protein n=1 Tax=Acerihabitans sp. KWT182 TaxID=3157919 RepID=A0AAU7Q7C2_9GAMM
MAAMSGIDIALWDILGKVANLPIYKLIGGYKNTISTYASGGFYGAGKGLDEFEKEIEGYMQQGYQAVKIKIGRNWDMPMNPLHYMPAQDFSVTLAEDMMRIGIARKVIEQKN